METGELIERFIKSVEKESGKMDRELIMFLFSRGIISIKGMKCHLIYVEYPEMKKNMVAWNHNICLRQDMIITGSIFQESFNWFTEH